MEVGEVAGPGRLRGRPLFRARGQRPALLRREPRPRAGEGVAEAEEETDGSGLPPVKGPQHFFFFFFLFSGGGGGGS